MKRRIEKVAVLGAGVMGSGIAAHLAGVGLKVLLLDIVLPDAKDKDKAARDALAAGALAKSLKSKPALFHDPDDARRIEVGNFDDDLSRVAECDWIVEVVKEDLSVKQALFEKVDQYRTPGTLVTSNTSGLSIDGMQKGRSEDFKKNFLVTHFFNPVRYMRLLELVPGPDTDPEVFEFMKHFGEDVVGKGVVVGRDTPNFVANRIGVYALMKTIKTMEEMELGVDAVDVIAGKPMGRPKSAAFRTADLVGLDTFVHVSNNCYENLPNDEEREVFVIPDWLKGMVEKGMLGDKTKGGFYKKTKEGVLAYDWKSGEYRPKDKPKFESIAAAKGEEDVGARVKKLLEGDDVAAKFAWKVTASTLAYSARRFGEIAGDLVNIDRGMRWGFNWEQGPFEAWDDIGVKSSVERMKKDGIDVPAWVDEFVASGNETFYKREDGTTSVWDPVEKAYKPIVPREGFLFLQDVKDRTKPIFDSVGATVLDLGDGVCGVEFHTKMNAIDDDIIAALEKGLEWAEREGVGMVIGNEAKTAFSAGANLLMIYMLAQNKDWKTIEEVSARFQQANLRLKYAPVPVVAAPHGLTLGGGCEIVLHSPAVQAGAETYMGLVEVGVGLIPGAGGTKEMAFRMANAIPDGVNAMKLPFLQKAFEAIALAKVATGAGDARHAGFLRPSDGITMNPDRLIADAKRRVLAMAELGYAPKVPEVAVLPGRDAATVFDYVLDDFKARALASDHDVLIGRKVAHVLCGGDTDGRRALSEQEVLDLEREAFMSLVGEEKSQARIQHMLMNNKPLRN